MINPAIQDPPEPSAMQNDFIKMQRNLLGELGNWKKYMESIPECFYSLGSDTLDKIYYQVTDFEKEVKAMECPNEKDMVPDND